MTIKPWRATCIQMKSRLATKAADRDEAWEIIKGNIDRAVAMIEATCEGPNPPKLVVLPEFGMQGPPHGGTVADWIESRFPGGSANRSRRSQDGLAYI
jgi:predicted amidohydrolase